MAPARVGSARWAINFKTRMLVLGRLTLLLSRRRDCRAAIGATAFWTGRDRWYWEWSVEAGLRVSRPDYVDGQARTTVRIPRQEPMSHEERLRARRWADAFNRAWRALEAGDEEEL